LSGWTATDVLEVGEGALELFFVLVVEGHLPEALPSAWEASITLARNASLLVNAPERSVPSATTTDPVRVAHPLSVCSPGGRRR